MSDERSDEREAPEPEIKVTDRRKFTASGDRIRAGDDDESPGQAPEPARPGHTEATFDDLVMGLVGTALMHLGEMPDAAGKSGPVNLAGAREAIDLLGILQQKTAGNLAAEEQAFLDQWLASLRMMYAQKA
jgi:hypothetical protein